MTENAAWVKMTDLGIRFGVTSHQIGKWLKELGLRTNDGQPTNDSLQSRLAKYSTSSDGYPQPLWNRDRTIELLKKAGHPLKMGPPPSLTGPFIMMSCGDDSYKIIGEDGLIATVIGERNAKRLCRMVEWFAEKESQQALS